MPITREQLKTKIAEVQAGIQGLEAQLNSAMGNLQNCQYWLAQLDAEEREMKKEAPDGVDRPV